MKRSIKVKRIITAAVAVASVCACLGADIKPFPEFSKPRAVTQGPYDHFLANYFAINAWSPDNRYLLVLETAIKDKLPDGTPCMLGLTDLEDGNRFIPIMPISTWNFQEAAMAHWLPNEKDTFIVNDMRDGKFVSVIKNWKTGGIRAEDITEEFISQHLQTNFMPDPDLLIRTGGELRISNYLLWQIAYSELYFCDTYWPDFDEECLHQAIISFQKRQRRFGKTEAQIEREIMSQND